MANDAARRTDRPLSRKEAARYLTELGLVTSAQTLARKFSEGRGPECMKLGNRAGYKESDLVAYFLQQASAPRRSSREPLRPLNPDELPRPANDSGTKQVDPTPRGPRALRNED